MHGVVFGGLWGGWLCVWVMLGGILVAGIEGVKVRLAQSEIEEIVRPVTVFGFRIRVVLVFVCFVLSTVVIAVIVIRRGFFILGIALRLKQILVACPKRVPPSAGLELCKILII